MIIVSGHLRVAPEQRDAYLATCVDVVAAARAADGCLDFAISPDLLDPGRVNVSEQWLGRPHLDAFRGAGIGGEQGAMLLEVRVEEHEVG